MICHQTGKSSKIARDFHVETTEIKGLDEAPRNLQHPDPRPPTTLGCFNLCGDATKNAVEVKDVCFGNLKCLQFQSATAGFSHSLVLIWAYVHLTWKMVHVFFHWTNNMVSRVSPVGPCQPQVLSMNPLQNLNLLKSQSSIFVLHWIIEVKRNWLLSKIRMQESSKTFDIAMLRCCHGTSITLREPLLSPWDGQGKPLWLQPGHIERMEQGRNEETPPLDF